MRNFIHGRSKYQYLHQVAKCNTVTIVMHDHILTNVRTACYLLKRKVNHINVVH